MSEPRELPTNVEAEQALLGTILRNNLAFDRVAEFLQEEHFSYAVHARLFGAIKAAIERGDRADPISFKNLFDLDPALKEIGGSKYLIRLAGSAATLLNAEDYGRRIHDLFIRRSLMVAAEELLEKAATFDLEKPASAIIEEHETRLFTLAEHSSGSNPVVKIGDAATMAMNSAQAAYQAGGRIRGVQTGLHDLDSMTGGLYGGDLVILGARPSMGKTAISYGIAEHASRQGPVMFFQLEQSAEQLGQRALAAHSGVTTTALRRGDQNIPWLSVTSAAAKLSDVLVYIDDTPGLTMSQIRQRLRSAKRRINVRMAIIDHLQLIRWVGKSESRRLEISAITGGLKILAKELGIPILLLSQLGRGLEGRDSKRPILSDLIESGSSEADADVALLLWREEYYAVQQEPSRRGDEPDEKFNDRYVNWRERCSKVKNLGELILAKQRQGPTGLIKLHWDPEMMQFSSVAREDAR